MGVVHFYCYELLHHVNTYMDSFLVLPRMCVMQFALMCIQLYSAGYGKSHVIYKWKYLKTSVCWEDSQKTT